MEGYLWMQKGMTWEIHIKVESALPRELPQIERGGHSEKGPCLSLNGMYTWSTYWVPEASRSSKETVFPKFKIPLIPSPFPKYLVTIYHGRRNMSFFAWQQILIALSWLDNLTRFSFLGPWLFLVEHSLGFIEICVPAWQYLRLPK